MIIMTSEITMFSTDSGYYFTVDTDATGITTVYKGSRQPWSMENKTG